VLAARHLYFFKVLAARKTYLITARARRNKHTARMLASARKDHSIPLTGAVQTFTTVSLNNGSHLSRYFRQSCLILFIMNSKRQIGKARVFRLQNHGDITTKNDFPAV